jgi:hypothetical protein
MLGVVRNSQMRQRMTHMLAATVIGGYDVQHMMACLHHPNTCCAAIARAAPNTHLAFVLAVHHYALPIIITAVIAVMLR